MKRAKKATVRERLADLLELPGDLAYNGCIITLIGEREILLENSGVSWNIAPTICWY